MKVKVTFPRPEEIEWHFPPELPEKDGSYWAVTRWKEFDPELHYTVEYGWNTSRGKDGIVMHPETALKNYALAWAEIVSPRLELDGEAIECSFTQ